MSFTPNWIYIAARGFHWDRVKDCKHITYWSNEIINKVCTNQQLKKKEAIVPTECNSDLGNGSHLAGYNFGIWFFYSSKTFTYIDHVFGFFYCKGKLWLTNWDKYKFVSTEKPIFNMQVFKIRSIKTNLIMYNRKNKLSGVNYGKVKICLQWAYQRVFRNYSWCIAFVVL